MKTTTLNAKKRQSGVVISIHAVMKTTTLNAKKRQSGVVISIHAVMKTTTAIKYKKTVILSVFLMTFARLYMNRRL